MKYVTFKKKRLYFFSGTYMMLVPKKYIDTGLIDPNKPIIARIKNAKK